MQAPVTIRMLLLLGLGAGLTIFAAARAQPPPALDGRDTPVVVGAELHGVINPIKVRYLKRVFEDASRQGASAVLISIDTPGGLVSSMQEIVQLITHASLPVIGLVEPATAQATSAGALVLLATDVSAMLPDTRVGAAHPVGAGAPLQGAVEKKATQSLASLARSLAEQRGRAADAAEAMVRKSVSYTAKEALDKRVVDLIVDSRVELLGSLDGRTIKRGQREFRLRTRDAVIRSPVLSWSERVLDAAADPTLASLLLTIGVLGILYELASPGIGLGGVAGVTALLMALLAMSVLPVRLAGIALLVTGLCAIALEIKTTAHGLLGLGGLGAICVGAVVLVDDTRYFGALPQIKWGLFMPAVVIASLCVVAFARVVRRSQQPAPRMGREALPGSHGRVRSALLRCPEGFVGSVWVDGARWSALADCEIAADEPVEVIAVERHPTRLRVKRATLLPGDA